MFIIDKLMYNIFTSIEIGQNVIITVSN